MQWNQEQMMKPMVRFYIGTMANGISAAMSRLWNTAHGAANDRISRQPKSLPRAFHVAIAATTAEAQRQRGPRAKRRAF